MATINIVNQQKQDCGTVNLPPEIFEIEPRPEILNLVVRAQMAARRAGTHSAKTRANVSGGGVKPWKQKGTGRARAGSNRSPIWRGGAVIFGPLPRDYSFKVNSKVRALALKMALSSRLASNELMVLDKIAIDEPKTKLFAEIVKDLGLKKALVVLPERSEMIGRASGNIPGIKVITQEQLNVLDVLNHKQLVLLEDTVALIESRFRPRGEK